MAAHQYLTVNFLFAIIIMFLTKNKKAFASIVEVTITAIIFSIAALGIFSTISTLRPDSVDATKKIEAIYAGQQVLNELYNDIDATTWDNPLSNLATGIVHNRNIGIYSINYQLTNVPGLALRKLDMTITFP